MNTHENISILVTERFRKNLERHKRSHVEQKIELLLKNPSQPHPSLKAHRMQSKDFWELYLSDRARIIYRWGGKGILELHDIGDHVIVEQFHQSSAYNRLQPFSLWRRTQPQAPSQEPSRPFSRRYGAPSTPPPAGGSENIFRHLPEAHLRILGVPKDRVRAIQEATSLEALDDIGLPPHILERLQELATNAKLEREMREGRLLYRTTLDQLVGYIEGRIKRLMLNLTDEQRNFVAISAARPLLLRGCAGSGKTTIAVYRAIEFAKQGKRVLFLTFNRTLADAAKSMIEELIGSVPANLEVYTVDSWIRNLVRGRQGGNPSCFRRDEDCKQAIKQAISAVQRAQTQAFARHFPPDDPATETFLIEEIMQVVLPSGATILNEYLAWHRYGRGRALPEGARRIVWAVYEAYQAARRDQLHWDDLARLAAQTLRAQPLQPAYDHIIVDEVQDLSAARLRAILALLETTPRCNLFMVGDVAQSIYSRGFAWRDLGLNMRGRSLSLRKNFRNTRQIAEAAARLYANNKQLKRAEEFVDPEPIERTGPRPCLLQPERLSHAPKALIEKLLSLVEGETFRLSDFAILAPTNELCKRYQEALQGVQLRAAIHTDDDFKLFEEQVKILTIHSAKGLEFPVVFVVGLQEDILPRKSHALSQEELDLHLERERTLLYVAMTRACEGLFLVSAQEKPSCFVRELEPFVDKE